MGNLIKWIFFSTVKCVGKCGGEWVKSSPYFIYLLSVLQQNIFNSVKLMV